MFLKKRIRLLAIPLLTIFFATFILNWNTVVFATQADKKPVKIVVVEKPPSGNNKEGIPYDDVDKNGVTTMDATAKNYEDKKTALGIDHIIRAGSVKDMVEKILSSLKEDECISSLTIAGHGGPGSIGVGSGKLREPGNYINDNMEEWEDELAKLKDKFCPGASILLKGCNVGSCDKGAEKLQEIADVTGVPVEAPTGKAHPDCTYEDGSEMQRAEPSPPDSLESNEPPECKHSPEDKKKQAENASYEGPAPFNQDQVIGFEVFPIGAPISITDNPEFDVKPGDETFNAFMHGILYSSPVEYEKRQMTAFNALIVLRFTDGSLKMGMFENDFDHFLYPFGILDPESPEQSENYISISYEMETQLEKICERKLNKWKGGSDFNLKATPHCGYIELSWNPFPGASRYFVYRGPGEGLEHPMPLTDFPILETHYIDKIDLIPNQKYCYLVKAVDSEGREFQTSNEACAVFTCPEEIPPITEADCKMVLKYQVDNKYYWKNDIQKGPMDVAPVIREQRVFMMARYLAEETGANVGWDQTTKTVIITRSDGVEIRMQIGNPMASVGGQPVQIDPNNLNVVPFLENSRTYVGLRFIAYNLGATGPDEILWHGETRIAELRFKDPHCKWVCGCIRSIGPNPLANVAEFGFFSGCGPDSSLTAKIPSQMKDNLLKLTPFEYTLKYPNQNYWCAEARIDEAGNLTAWRATPGKYPDCCSEEKPMGRLRIYMPPEAAKGTDIEIFAVNGTTKKQQAQEQWVESFFDIYCELPCPGKYKVVPKNPNWIFIPESIEVTIEKCCPEITEITFKYEKS